MYEIKTASIKKLLVNLTNSRFIIPIKGDNEVLAIEKLCNDKENHIIDLLRDIKANDIHPNEFPVIMPSNDQKDYYYVFDGNRRITCLKLLYQYNLKIDQLKIPNNIKNEVRKYTKENKNKDYDVSCICSKDINYVNKLLDDLHTNKPGIGRLSWNRLAKEGHNLKTGKINKLNAIICLLQVSQYTTESTRMHLVQPKWARKFENFINNNEITYRAYGFRFSKKGNVELYRHESEVVKRLSILLYDCIHRKAKNFAQVLEDRLKYESEFLSNSDLDDRKINNPVILFNPLTKSFAPTDLHPIKTEDKNEFKSTSKAADEDVKKGDDIQSNNSKGDKRNSSNNDKKQKDADKKNQHNDQKEGKEENKNNSSKTRKTMIPEDVDYIISDPRTADLFKELQSTVIKGHRNIIAIAFRSLIEFSVNIYLETSSKSYNFNGKTLMDKIEKSINKLEAKHKQSVLKNIIPSIYQQINQVKNPTSSHGDIKMLNSLVHNYQFHPAENDLQVIYSNYSNYLKLLWDEINSSK